MKRTMFNISMVEVTTCLGRCFRILFSILFWPEDLLTFQQ